MKRMTKQDRIWLKKICKEYKVKCHLFLDPNFKGGLASPHISEIHVSKNVSGDRFRYIVLHEVAHCLNYRNKKFLIYHSNPRSKKRTLKYLKKYALRAEVYTDKLAMKLARKHGLKRTYRYYFFNDSCRKMLKEYYGWN